MENFLNFLRSKFNDTLPASILPPALKKFVKFSYVSQKKKKLCKYLHAKKLQNECVSRFRGSKMHKKIHKHKKHPKHTSKLIL